MVTPELVTYIATESARGVSRADIAKELLAARWKIEDINEGFNKAGIMNQTEKIAATPATAVEAEVKNTQTQEPITDIQKPQTIAQQPIKAEPKKETEQLAERSYTQPVQEKVGGGIAKFVLGLFLGIILAAVAIGVAYWQGLVQISLPVSDTADVIEAVPQDIPVEPQLFTSANEVLSAMNAAIADIDSYQSTLGIQTQPVDPTDEVVVATTVQKNTRNPLTTHISTLIQKSGAQNESIWIGNTVYTRQPNGSWASTQVTEPSSMMAFDFTLPTELLAMSSSVDLVSSANGAYHLRGVLSVMDVPIVRSLGLVNEGQEIPADFSAMVEVYIDTETNLPQVLRIETTLPTETTFMTWSYDQYNQVAPAVPPVSA